MMSWDHTQPPKKTTAVFSSENDIKIIFFGFFSPSSFRSFDNYGEEA